MRRWIRYFLLVDTLIAVLAGASFYAYYAPGSATQPRTVMIEAGTGTRAILRQLHAQGLVPPLPVIAAPMLVSGHYRALKAGEYEFAAGLSPAQVMEKIVRGEVVVHKITIPEGWTNFQVREALLREPLLTGDLPAPLPEGSLLPDTMHFARGEARASVVARMQQAQQKHIEALWPTRAAGLPYATPQEALVMASIVERETGTADERAMVAGVFANRLRLGMRLQTDPSVIYGLEQAQGGAPLGRALTRADLQRDTVYNTYTRTGLPPTPICNPGRKAIEAALNPAVTDALYFVATGNGGHRFAATLKEHEENVAAYRNWQRRQTLQSNTIY